jgi:hypothetical protein
LIDLHELLIPVLDVGRLLARVGVVVLGWSGVVLVVFAPLEDLAEDGLADLEEGEEGGVSVGVGDVTCDGCAKWGWGGMNVRRRTFMMGIGSSPGAPRSSIMFLISMLRSATLRSMGHVS